MPVVVILTTVVCTVCKCDFDLRSEVNVSLKDEIEVQQRFNYPMWPVCEECLEQLEFQCGRCGHIHWPVCK